MDAVPHRAGDASGASRRRLARCRVDSAIALHLGPTPLRVVLVDLGGGGLRFRCSAVALAPAVLFQIYLERTDQRRALAWGEVVRGDAHGTALRFDRVEPDSVELLSDVAAWHRHPPTDLYVSPSSPAAGRRWWSSVDGPG